MRKFRDSLWILFVALLVVSPALAQHGEQQMTPEQQAQMEAYMKAATPGPQHQAMAAEAGAWDLAIKSWMEPGAPPMESKGSATREMILGGRVLVEEVTSEMMGMPFTGQGMRGFDNVTGKYWGTWIDSMGTGLMVSEGTCNEQQKTCAFTGSWNDPVTKKPVKARMNTKMTSPTVEVFEMYAPGPDGKEMKMMEITYTKKK